MTAQRGLLSCLPNFITGLRILLIPPFLWLLLQGSYGSALGLFLLAGASDGLDGFLARRYDWRSRVGAVLDPLADKLLMLCSYLTLGWLQVVPWWLVGLVLLRDAVIVGGALVYYRLFGAYDMEPLWSSKLNTVLQIMLVVAVLLALWSAAVPRLLPSVLVWLVAGSTLISGAAYVWIWSRRACGEGRRQ